VIRHRARLVAGALTAVICSMVVTLAGNGCARPPADDFLNPQAPGQLLTLMPFLGPGFRAVYDRRFDIERDMSDLRLQVMGTVAVPFSEVSAHLDARFFLMTFGASAGYHDEWHLLRFNPDPNTGRDRAGQPPGAEPPAASLPPGQNPLPPDRDPTTTFADLDRTARAAKDAHADVGSARWPFFEGRWGFLWPAYGFMGVSTLAVRHDDRPDVSYDWENATVSSHGSTYRWEGYFLFRERNTGFIGPALRALYLPRHRVEGNPTLGPYEVIVPEGSACQMNEGIPCHRRYEFEFHYGVLAGLRPSWGAGTDTLLLRIFAAWGLDNRLFGTHSFRQPLQILVAYMANIEL
jgi:hypothetical protein